MAKIKVKIAENTRMGTNSFYAVPQWAGTLSTEEILDEALDGKSIEPSVAKAAIEEFMKAVQRNDLKGFRCQLGKEFLTVYPNIQASAKDVKDKTTGEVTPARRRHGVARQRQEPTGMHRLKEVLRTVCSSRVMAAR